MKKNIMKSRLKTVMDKTVKKTMSTDPSSLGIKQASGNIKVGAVTIIKNKDGADIVIDGKTLYKGIKNGNAVQGIVNRLVSKRKIDDIRDILALEKEYVRKKNDLMFMKHLIAHKSTKPEDAEIRQHRIGHIVQIIEDIDDKLYMYKNI